MGISRLEERNIESAMKDAGRSNTGGTEDVDGDTHIRICWSDETTNERWCNWHGVNWSIGTGVHGMVGQTIYNKAGTDRDSTEIA